MATELGFGKSVLPEPVPREETIKKALAKKKKKKGTPECPIPKPS